VTGAVVAAIGLFVLLGVGMIALIRALICHPEERSLRTQSPLYVE